MSLRNVEALLKARKVALIGVPQSPADEQISGNLRATASELHAFESLDTLRALPTDAIDIAVVIDSALVDAQLVQALARCGCAAIVWTALTPVPDKVLSAAGATTMRVIGPRSAGIVRGGGLDASALPAALPGRIALIAQSGSVASAAMDWARGRNIGFSWVATTGAEADIDVGDLLDHAALDPQTRAIVLQLAQLRSARKFMSAARACARSKPVIVIQSRIGDDEQLSGPDPVRSAAFQRAGLLECDTLDSVFDALAALHQLPPLPDMRILVTGNGVGICALGVDAVTRYGLTHARLSPETREAMQAAGPRVRPLYGAVDVGPSSPEALAEVLRLALADGGVDYVIVVHSPYVGQNHAPFFEALQHAGLGQRILTVWLGLATSMDVRRRSVEAGMTTFVSAGQAARALRYRLLHRQTQQMLMQTPPQVPIPAINRAAAAVTLDAAFREQCCELSGPDALRLLAGYGLDACPPQPILRIGLAIERHPEVGTYLELGAEAPGLLMPKVRSFPPLDALLVGRALDAMSVDLAPEARERLSKTLLSLSQLALDQPHIRGLRLHLGIDAQGRAGMQSDAVVRLDPDPPPERQRLLLAPYPSEFVHEATVKNGRRFRVRPVLPEDEPRVIQLLERLSPEEIRLRFFHTIRYFSHEMAARMTQIDYDREHMLVASPEEDPTQLAGLAHLVSDADGNRAEYAVLVHRDWAGLGLGRHLMQQLLHYARARQIRVVFGEVLAENGPMLRLAADLGFRRRPNPEDPGTVCVEIDLTAPAAPAV